MGYQVLARKWRPRTFKELVGQAHVLQAIVNALDSGRLHHAYLFTGTRGVGKTTIARILARCLNCENGVTSQPCGQCDTCQEIDQGRFVDLIEVDAASRTRVEDTRELLDNVQYAPTRGRFKVYLIDEVHMLSTHSFNALLKTLEEPPPHIKFLLATTDPQKLPITILSRCLQFNLKNMPPEQIVEHLQTILNSENIACEQQALWLLARTADGSMRDALSLTDQAIAYCGGELSAAKVAAMLGTIDRTHVYSVIEALAAQNAAGLMDIVANLAAHSPDYAMVLGDLLSVLHRVALAQVLPDAVDNSQGDRERVLALAGRITSEDVQLFYQIALLGRKDLALAADPRAGFEMVLLRMLAFRPDGIPVQEQGPSPDHGSPTTAGDPADMPPADSSPVQTGAAPATTEVMEQENTAHTGFCAADARTEANDPQPLTERESPAAGTLMPPAFQHTPDESATSAGRYGQSDQASAATEMAAHPQEQQQQGNSNGNGNGQQHALTEKAVPSNGKWSDLCAQLQLQGIAKAVAEHCEMVAFADNKVTLRLEHTQDALYGEGPRDEIERALADHFGRPIELFIDSGEIDTETPAAKRERLWAERCEQARQAFYRDERVQALVEKFSATIIDRTIKPVEPELDCSQRN